MELQHHLQKWKLSTKKITRPTDGHFGHYLSIPEPHCSNDLIKPCKEDVCSNTSDAGVNEEENEDSKCSFDFDLKGGSGLGLGSNDPEIIVQEGSKGKHVYETADGVTVDVDEVLEDASLDKTLQPSPSPIFQNIVVNIQEEKNHIIGSVHATEPTDPTKA
ncbi:hypothetical protein L1987_09018 [Smallanthus sonchifolius]|uniref:Uncharacterized protein n=1 Tax=Smallanthus sonchifolius TaxID=185202 RepID=A0ACB9JP79_9ASTR|nr:hypothetical protein L1987_09018 [Smallanthus sonchifolius]